MSILFVSLYINRPKTILNMIEAEHTLAYDWRTVRE